MGEFVRLRCPYCKEADIYLAAVEDRVFACTTCGAYAAGPAMRKAEPCEGELPARKTAEDRRARIVLAVQSALTAFVADLRSLASDPVESFFPWPQTPSHARIRNSYEQMRKALLQAQNEKRVAQRLTPALRQLIRITCEEHFQAAVLTDGFGKVLEAAGVDAVDSLPEPPK